MTQPYRAFWMDPDWSGGDNLRDPGTRAFWELPPARNREPTYDRVPGMGIVENMSPEQRLQLWHVCGPIVTLWTGYRYCEVCERPIDA